MKKNTIITVLILIILLSNPVRLVALDTPQVSGQELINSLVDKYSSEYKVSRKVMLSVIDCESESLDPAQQSSIKYKKGNRWGLTGNEQSYGYAQIHLPDHPEVSYEQATDPDFSIEFLAKNLSNGKGSMWSCYRKIYG